MPHKTSPVLWEGWFSFEVPDEWEFEEHEGLISIHSEFTSTHISCFARVSKEAPSDGEVKRMALDFAREQGFTSEDVTLKTLDGSPCAQLDSDDDEKPRNHWLVHTVVDDTRAILMTSVSLAKNADAEREETLRMINSFAWDDPLEN